MGAKPTPKMQSCYLLFKLLNQLPKLMDDAMLM